VADVHTQYDEKKVADFIRSRSDKIRAFVRGAVQKAGVDPDERIRELLPPSQGPSPQDGPSQGQTSRGIDQPLPGTGSSR
jgi:hypothetical protein